MAGQSIVISVLADTKKLASGLNEASGMLGGLGKAASAGAKVALGALAAVGAAATGIGIKAVSSASNLEQSMGAMSSVFKENTAQMETWATGAASSVGLAKSEYAGLATVLGSQLRNMGVSADALGGQTNDLIGLGSDLAAQFGGSTSDAVSALSGLLRGERDPIERYGVSINEAAVKAKLAEMGLNGLTGEAEKNAKLTATLALLYEQTADAQGAFSRESTTLAGAQQRLSAGTENLYATLGTSLLPAVTAVTAAMGALINRIQESAAFQALTGWLTDASNSFADFVFGIINGTESLNFSDILGGLVDGMASGIQSAVAWLADGGLATIFGAITGAREGILNAAMLAFPGILDALILIIPQVVTGLSAMLLQLVTFFAANAPAILAAAVTMLSGLIGAIAQVLPQVITSLVAILPGLINSILSMIPQILDAAIVLFTSLVEAIPVILPGVVSAIVRILPILIETIIGLIPAILDGAIALFTSLVEAIPVILPMLIEALINLVPTLISTILGMIPTILSSAVKLFTSLVTAIPKILPELIPALIALLPKIIGAIIGMVPTILQAGVDLIGGLVSGLWQAAGSVGSALLDIAKGAIGGFLDFLGIHSPSRLFAGYGKNLVQGLAGGLDANSGLFARSLDGLAGMASDFSAEPLTISPSGALTAQTVASVPMAQPQNDARPALVDLSASSAQLLARLIADGLTVVLPGATLAGSMGAHNVFNARRGNG
ncbi:phage tail protein [Microbacterium murale]|uniref:Tape measure protein n=1 Tax=Microbacterium murale TaxID=1081040 RepID=A0ABU0PEC5_9MICO|nr:hypothetical protein [Microbacterium murale]MDQ0645668.1 hypothetical protein [Microbacterium murale]